MIDKVRDFILEYQELEQNPVNIEYLKPSAVSYSLMEEALFDAGRGVGVIRHYGNGQKLKEYKVRLLRVADYEEVIETNVENSNFMREFGEWIEQKNDLKELPDIDGIQSVNIYAGGSLEAVAQDQLSAVYGIGLRFVYLERKGGK